VSEGKQERVLVAGGAGFIGSHLCEALLAAGHQVICLDNFVTGHSRNVAHLESNEAFRLVEAEVTATPELAVDRIFHLASPASPIHYKEHAIETMIANSAGTHRLLELARANRARFLFASTSEVYGDPLEHPQRETYWGNVNPIGPRACYDESKRFGEAMTMEYVRIHGLNASIVRIFNTYGPRMNIADGRVVPALIAAGLAGEPLPVHGDGTQTRSFCYVADLVAGLRHVGFDDEIAGEVFNLGNPHELTINEFAHVLASVMNTEPTITNLPRGADDPSRRRPDISRINARFGWEPQVALEEGLRKTVDYFRGIEGVTA